MSTTTHRHHRDAPTGSARPEVDSNLARGQQMRNAVSKLLDRVPNARKALPHLAAFEKGLGTHGIDAITRASPRGLQKVHTQLRVLPLDANDGAIQDLLARIQNTLRRHAAKESQQEAQFDPQATMVITEITHSAFMEAMDDAKAPRNPLLASSLDAQPAHAFRSSEAGASKPARSGPPPGVVPLQLHNAQGK
jgi:hypothetical protein